MGATGTEAEAMRRALDLALLGPRSRNPQVGAVVLNAAGDVIAEGWHRGAGTAHAEVDALSHLADAEAVGATMVVTLEPCNHTGRTGPCAAAIIEAGISRVIYALPDPGKREGGGAERLRAANVEVVAGAEAQSAADLLATWFAARALGRARVTVKWAQSLDGRAAATDGSSKWITGAESRADVHERRGRAHAIVAGIGTVLADDPALTARPGGVLGDTQPVPVIVGERDVPQHAAVRDHPQPIIHHRGHDLRALASDLFDRGLHTALVEGGPTLASAFIAAGIADELLIYTAPVLLGGGRTALTDVGVASIDEAITLDIIEHRALGADTLLVARPAASKSTGEDDHVHGTR